jgi:hypothetical protein
LLKSKVTPCTAQDVLADICPWFFDYFVKFHKKSVYISVNPRMHDFCARPLQFFWYML